MRFLIVGAGAIGGYFGGRLLAAGADVTFLVRERRAAQLAESGLVITSPHGDLWLPSPPHVLSADIRGPFDVVVVSCKAYDLAETMESFAAAVGPETSILPLLNGLRHMDDLIARFGSERVLGGQCIISSTLDEQGAVHHLNEAHTVTFGEVGGGVSTRVGGIHNEFSRANFVSVASAEIMQDMWEKWVFIASAAALTCLMRASIGNVVAAGGAGLGEALLEECRQIAAHNGFAPRGAALERSRTILTTPGSPLTASMFKDVERGARTEADHVIGDLIARGQTPASWSPLQIAYTALRSHESRRTAPSTAA